MSLLGFAEKVADIKTAIDLGDAAGATAATAQVVGTTALGIVVSAYTIPRAGLSLVFDGIRGQTVPNAQKRFLAGLVAAESASRAIDRFNESGYGADIIENVVDAHDDIVADLTELIENGENTLDDILDYVGNTIDDSLKDAKEWVDQLSDDFHELIDDVSDGVAEVFDELSDAAEELFNWFDFDDVEDAVNEFFNNARNWIQRSDPLTLDLDGDGLETTGIDPTNPILFDHDGDGTANATGWVKPDDGYLVLDRNENGLIDNGTELFGDSTPLLDENGDVVGQAADGFAALAAEDTNGDGIVDANDANWDRLRVWQDLNSDGKTDEGELKTLEELGVAGFHVAKEENNQVLANGNAIADLGSYIKADGSEGALGEVTGNMADIDLADNPFYREFDDSIPLTEQAEALPNMRGSGHLRDLQEASSLSPELAAAVEEYAQGTTKSQQLARLDRLIERWAASSSGETSIEKADDQGYNLNYLVPGLSRSMLKIQVSSRWSSQDDGGGSSLESSRFSEEYQERLEALLAEQARVTKLVGLLEQFNGMTFVDIEPEGVRTGADEFISISTNSSGPDGVSVHRLYGATQDVYVPLSSAQINFLEQAYESLRSSVYDGLLLQTRLKPYMDAINLGMNDDGLAFDFSNVTATLESHFDEAPSEAVRDLLDLQRMAGSNLTGMGWDGLGTLYGWLETEGDNPDVQAALAEFGYSNIETDGTGSHASEILTGDVAGDTLAGGSGNDLLLGSEGNDTLNGGSGNDTLYGGAGNDTYRFDRGDRDDTIIETHGDTGEDALEFGAGIRAGNLDISAEDDALIFSRYGSNDRIAIANWFGSLVEGKHRVDTVRFSDGRELDLDALQVGSSEDDTLEGTEANDILAGGEGGDILYGRSGDDWLDGGSGADTLVGGTGNDTYVVDDASDTVIEEVDGGIDTVEARTSAMLSDNVENLALMGQEDTNGTGNGLDNMLIGNSGSNTLSGGTGDDILHGRSGDDTLQGGAGADVMAGGQGNDTYIVDSLEDTVTEKMGDGLDTVQTHLDYTLGDNLENLTLTGEEGVSGVGNALNNTLTGNSANNTLQGRAGDDQLNGGAGEDIMLGGSGNDTYVVESHGDTVKENSGEGIDTVESAIGYTLTDNVENLTLTGQPDIDGTGNEHDNVIRGNDGANTLRGLEGNDWLNGGGGTDTLIGGTGNDTYVVDNAGDTVTEEASEGTDTVRTSSAYTLGENLENLTLTGSSAIDGTGNELDNVISGNRGNNTLDGGSGADTMAGGQGDDIYILDDAGDSVVESGHEGIDKVVSPFDYTLGNNVENLTLTDDAQTGTGNNLDNTLTGTDADNTLHGLDGNDSLDGGAGADTLVGGRGDDTYIVDRSEDGIFESAGEGSDTVQSSVTWRLGDNLEDLSLSGTDGIDGIGNELGNTINGNIADNLLQGLEGNDTLDGGAGADTLEGGSGNDTYVVDNMDDAVVEVHGEGVDSVKAIVSYTLVDNVENLTLTGYSSINGTGNNLDNALKGNGGANVLEGFSGDDSLDGGLGVDTLVGGEGDDTYFVDNSGDSVVESLGKGYDRVFASASHTMGENVEELTLTGSGSIDGIGNDLNNTLTGNAGGNRLDGADGADTMTGGAGNDTYVVNHTGDEVAEAAYEGFDTVEASIDYTLGDYLENLTLKGGAALTGIGNSLNNVLQANSGDSALHGMAGNDTLLGNVGADYLDGGSGADGMAGGDGNDRYVVDDAGDRVVESSGEGHDTVDASVSYTLTGSVEDLELAGNEVIDGTGNSLDNTITGNNAANRIDGSTGADTLIGAAGDDTYVVDNTDDSVFEASGEGVDTVEAGVSYTLAENVENLVLTGSAALEGNGNALNNILTGNAENNTLDGGTGIDTLIGGAGDDTYVVDDSADAVVENADEGLDTVIASADYALSDNVENLTLTGNASLRGTGNALDNLITSNDGINVLVGGAGDDTYIVNHTQDSVVEQVAEGTDTVLSSATYTLSDNVESLTLTGEADIDGTGNRLANTILGNSGTNTLDGGAGADSMAGGAGDDTYIVDHAGDEVSEVSGEGSDLVYSSVSHTLSNNVENLTLTGAGDINGTGNNLDNTILGNTGDNMLKGGYGEDQIEGGAGNDTLNGGSGADSMAGGTGNDTYVVDNSSDQVTELAGEGTDTVQSRVSYTLTDNVENLTLTGYSGISGTGNELDNVIRGNNGSNTLRGLAGGDTLVGNNGHDTLDGGTGADTMSGGSGNDTYVVDDAGDVVSETSYWGGTDHVQSSIDYTLTSNVENLTLTGVEDLDGTGNNLNNVITGNSGDNVLDGAAGADTLVGGLGNDTYIVDHSADVTEENAGEGNDHVMTSANYTLSENLENLTLTGDANISGAGNASDNQILGNVGNNELLGNGGDDTLIGGAGNDTILGGSDRDQLFGQAGNDLLDGGDGADVMQGGVGDDTYVVDSSADVITENAGEGIDTVRASIDYTLGENVENLELVGSSALNTDGNGSDNTLIGNDGENILKGLGGSDTLMGRGGDDTLDGGTGADLMSGGIGNDHYIVDDVGDSVLENAHEGTDTVQAEIDYTMADNVENLVLSGDGDLSGTGNTLDNVITGNTGDNVLDGAGGADVMAGGVGDDVYIVDNPEDAVLEQAGEGVDTVYASSDHSLDANVENLILTGASEINGNGNELDNSITGNASANILQGGDGDDWLNGGAGADNLYGGRGNDNYIVDSVGDRVLESAGEGEDTVESSVDFALGENVENLTLVGPENLSGSGNDLDNWLQGNEANNTLVGEAGDDVLAGGKGDDVLAGGAGNDRYVFRPGDGMDTFRDIQGQNSFYVGGALTEYDLEADRVGNDMVVRVLGTSDSFVLADWFGNQEGINSMEFDDGTVLDRDGIALLMNRPPVANMDNITIGEDQASLSVETDALLANDTDPNPEDILSVVSVGESQVGAEVSLGNGEVTYSIGDSFQYLAEGESVEDSFSYTITDDKGATDTGTIEATVVGANDLPVAESDFETVKEDEIIAAEGNVLANDSDIDATDVLTIAEPGNFEGQYGTLALAENGDYTYTLNNESDAIQSLGRSMEVTDRFDFAVTDGHAQVASSLAVNVQGTNDAPLVATALNDQDFTFNKPFSWQIPEGSFDDPDQGDSLDYTATLADGSELPEWLEFDAETQTFSGHTPKSVGYVDIKVTVTDRVAATGNTEGSLSTSDVFRLSVSHGNQGVGNGADAAPAGHTSNFNDGPGTAPGKPGAPTRKGKREADTASSIEFGSSSQSSIKFADLGAMPAKKQSSQLGSSVIDINKLLSQWEAVDRYASSQMQGKSVVDEADLGSLPADAMGGAFSAHRRMRKSDPLGIGNSSHQMNSFRGLQDGMENLG